MRTRPYPPSWVDRLTATIEKLPIPSWIVYLLAALPWVVAFVVVQAGQGAYRDDGFYPWHLFVAVQPFFGVAAIHYLDRVGANALEQFRSAMRGDQADFDYARYRLTTLPARQTMIAGVLGLLFASLQVAVAGDAETTVALVHVASTPVALAAHNFNIIVAWIGYAVVLYHAYHQLRVIDWLYRSRAIIDPFYPQPLYALSEITSRTAILLLIVIYGWFAVAAGGSLRTLPTERLFYLTSVGVLGLGLVVFVWPLWGAHRLLVNAKNQELKSNASAYKVALEKLHSSIFSQDHDEIEIWQKAIAAIDLEQRHVDHLATWPWSPGTLRNLLVALIFPLLVWIIQYGLQQLMG